MTIVEDSARSSQPGALAILMLAVWFGLVTGLVEGVCLLQFQRINWANWGRMAHVSVPIIWIAPLWDLLWFVLVGLGVALLGRLQPKLPTFRIALFLFAFLMFYDWFTIPGRLTYKSSMILAAGLATVLLRKFAQHQVPLLRFWKSSLPWVAAALIVAWAGIEGGARVVEKYAANKLPPAQPNAPNVIVIVIDTLRADHLSIYGYGRATSPNLAEIAKGGVLFENAIASSSWTLPSHASLLTGRYSYEHGATDVKSPAARTLDERYPTLSEIFVQHGYRTGAFSANDLYFSKDLGFGRGFLHFEDYFHSAFDCFSRTLYGKEFARLTSPAGRVRRLLSWVGFSAIVELQRSSLVSWTVRKRAKEVNREALEWIDHDSSRPFFVFLNYFDAHGPYTTPPDYPKKFQPLQAEAGETGQSLLHKNKILAYDEDVAYVDEQIGKFLDALKARGLEGRTLLTVTSDHGDLLGEHELFGHKNALYRPLIRVPLIFFHPGRVPAGVRIPTPVSNVLLSATLTDLVGFSDATVFPGPSLSALWPGGHAPAEWPHPLSELARFKDEPSDFPSHHGSMNSLVTPQYHYIFHEQFGTELYDWNKDPAEAMNLSKMPSGKAVADSLATEIRGTMHGAK